MKKSVKTLGILVGCCLAIIFINWHMKNNKNELDEMTRDRDKLWNMFWFLSKWMNAKIAGADIEKYLIKEGYTNVAIYGMSNLGQALINDLENSSISIKYGIDKDVEVYWDVFPIISPDQIEKYDFSGVDAVIVTAISFFEEIKVQLSKKLDCPIISLEDIV